MAHTVTFDIQTKVALAKDVKFEIRNDQGKLGELLISKGNIEWKAANKQVKKHRLSWEKFAFLMEQEGQPVKNIVAVKKNAAKKAAKKTVKKMADKADD